MGNGKATSKPELLPAEEVGRLAAQAERFADLERQAGRLASSARWLAVACFLRDVAGGEATLATQDVLFRAGRARSR